MSPKLTHAMEVFKLLERTKQQLRRLDGELFSAVNQLQTKEYTQYTEMCEKFTREQERRRDKATGI